MKIKVYRNAFAGETNPHRFFMKIGKRRVYLDGEPCSLQPLSERSQKEHMVKGGKRGFEKFITEFEFPFDVDDLDMWFADMYPEEQTMPCKHSRKWLLIDADGAEYCSQCRKQGLE